MGLLGKSNRVRVKEDRERQEDDRRCEHCGEWTRSTCRTRNCYGYGQRPLPTPNQKYSDNVERILQNEYRRGGGR